MSQLIEIKVPDIGDFNDVPVIELYVKPGDSIAIDASICTLESDKAKMDIPSPAAGVIKEVLIKLGDKVSEGAVLVRLEAAVASTTASPATALAQTAIAPQGTATGGGDIVDVKVPDIGDFTDVPVIELYVKPGDSIAVDDAICTLESDKATMDVPSSTAGIIKEVLVKLGDKVTKDSLLIRVESIAGAASAQTSTSTSAHAATADQSTAPAAAATPATSAASAAAPSPITLGGKVHASPAVRAYARELGVDLSKVKPGGPKNRILREDVTAFIKNVMSSGALPGVAAGTGVGLDLLPWPKIDFAKFGEIDIKPLSRIKKISGANLARNWVMIPAVTYHEDADITELEVFRVQINKENEKNGKKLTMLAFLIKACVSALQKFPEFNTSLDGDNLVYKKYFNIGFAADTPNGLVVPVVKNADKKGVFDIAAETGELAKKARDGKLGPAEMSGACFTISSLGGIGGTYFSPIVNAPEVAILGVNKNAIKPVWDGERFNPRLILPLSLSADHRVVDGALATRFNVYLAQLLLDFRRAML